MTSMPDHAPPLDRTVIIERVDSTVSTQSVLRDRIRARGVPERPTMLVAAEQSGGVGRLSRPWASPRGGLWCTLALGLRDRGTLDGLGLRVGVACLEFVRGLAAGVAAERITLKWPNDVLIDGRKTLGVLCELIGAPDGLHRPACSTGTGGQPGTPHVSSRPAALLIGVGLNANFPVAALPLELRATATTLRDALGVTIDLGKAATDLAARLVGACAQHGIDAATLAAARRSLHGIGGTLRWTMPSRRALVARLIGLDRTGAVVLESDGSRWPAPDSIAEGPCGGTQSDRCCAET